MVSVIVPIYKVEKYLCQCIDSIIGQTYRDLEIILIDDGSPDACGRICDEYARKDKRIKVYHKENGGLSDARNYGIRMATGEYLGFVDSDDWIELDMFETLVSTAEENNADIVSCGYFREDSDCTIVCSDGDMMFNDSVDLVKALLRDDISVFVWNKLYRKSCLPLSVFSKGHVYEDISIMHKILLMAARGESISKPLYHYRSNRLGSINQSRSMDNLIDYWLAHKSRYDNSLADRCFNEDKEIIDKLRFWCALAIARTWRWCYANTQKEIKEYSSFLVEMQHFAKNNLSRADMESWPFHLKFTIFLARFKYPFVFALLYYLNQVYRKGIHALRY